MELLGKVGLVTGSSRGIGRAIALELAEAGCDVAVNYVNNEQAAHAVVEQIQSLGRRAKAYRADVSNEEQTNAMVEQAQKDFGLIQVVVNNAGITEDKSFLKMTRDQWHKVLLVNLDGPMNITAALLPSIVNSGWGRVINMTSIVAQMGNFGQSNYAVAKGGLIAFTKSLAREVSRKGVTVNAVAPGFIETDMTAKVSAETLEWVKKMTPVGRLGKPEEVAVVVRFLAHPKSAFITGQVVSVNGGMYMG
ncbi:MAG TPA: beta-ketoacyl-ACP reductase [Phycisphaerae bacterium]|jgi:3-oxoacyl-(acyl-carrier-protein) reductase